MSFASTTAFAARALVMPWSFDHRRDALSRLAAAVLAVGFVLTAAVLSTMLSTWTYLVGKGLLVAVNEMDMGRDDLPADTVRQVVIGLAGSVATWTIVLAGVMLICLAVADVLYRHDRSAWRVAVQRTSAATVWFIVWAVVVLGVNSVHQGEVRHPAAAIRAYAQLNQRWFRGSSAEQPGPIEREPLVAHGRLLPLAIAFPIIWSLALPARARDRRAGRLELIALAILLSWLVWAGVWRVLPWTAIDALAG